MSERLPPAVPPPDPGADLLAWMKAHHEQHGDVFRSRLFGGEIYVATDPAYADHVLRRNYQNYRKGLAIRRVGLLLGSGLMVSEGTLWKTQRRMIQPAFHAQQLLGMCETIRCANAVLLRRWQDAADRGQPVNITRQISETILEIVLRVIFGDDDYPAVAARFSVLSEEPVRDLRFAQTFREADGLLLGLIGARRERPPRPDILGMMMQARDRDTGRGMSERQLVNEIFTLIVAGHETTASTLNWIWHLLSRHPDVEARLHAELHAGPELGAVSFEALARFHYARQVIEETLRLYPAGWLMTRRALGDDRLGEWFVPAGTEIYIPVYLIQRHPAFWTDPDRFDPDRFNEQRSPPALLPFSAGPRNCIGEHLARLEMHVHLVMLARRLRLRCTDSASPELDLGVNLRSRQDFVMLPERVT